MKYSHKSLFSLAFLAMLAMPFTAPAQLVRSAADATGAGIQSAVDTFRLDLGGGSTSSGGPGLFGGVRREINWDGTPDSFSAPNNLPANFFNVNSPRGVVFSTPGTGFQVSANTGMAPVQFGNLDPSYPTLFEPFSPQRLFTAVGSNVLDVSFFVAGTTSPALTRGFGSVFSDVDVANTSSIQFFDASDSSLGTFFVPNISGADQTFSFLGVSFPTPVVSRVRITSGNQILGPASTAEDLVVMDDFIYGEPVAAASVPDTAGSALLLGLALASLWIVQRAVASPVAGRLA